MKYAKVFSSQDFQLNSIEELAIFYILWKSSRTGSLWKFRKSSICLRANQIEGLVRIVPTVIEAWDELAQG